MNKDQEKKEQQQQLAIAEKKIALYVVQNYSNVKSIKFSTFKFNKQTGSWHVATQINHDNLMTFSLENLNDISEETIGIRYNLKTFNLKKKKDTTKNINDIKILKEELDAN
ncbi:hypothetical protein [Carnobacterium divergens]|uniref:hypothetical protein n=1 Tax=Carnobacterium divergens TaxID=2748 RepID=UPI00288EEEC2|nr:hypothetical protein [Carnobacterium divergens]MDT2012992.1 hypothetical protein [Carnobacterium divergens]